MNFDSAIFLFLAFPILMIIYVLLGKKARNIFLFITNILLYAFGEPIYIFLLLGTMALNFGFGLISKKHKAEKPRLVKTLFICLLCINLSLLVFFKYITMLGELLNSVLWVLGIAHYSVLKVALPLGISFYVFQAVSYIIDVYTEKCAPATNFIKFGVYYSCFAQITAGPIVRYNDIKEELDDRIITLDGFSLGLKRFLIGLGQKILIANFFGKVANEVFNTSTSALGAGGAWVGIIFYTLQIYFDFAGYSSMAIGVAKMLGFNYKENFNHPYVADSLTDFWRRWHVSLSTFFRDYVYFTIGGNRKGKFKMYLGLFLVFALSGIWHGANVTFLVWGIYHAIFNMIEKPKPMKNLINKTPKAIRHFYTMLVVTIGWVFFRASSISYAFGFIGSMFFANGFSSGMPALSFAHLILFIVGIIGSTPLLTIIKDRIYKTQNKGLILSLEIVSYIFLIAVFVVCVPVVLSGKSAPFIYAQF